MRGALLLSAGKCGDGRPGGCLWLEKADLGGQHRAGGEGLVAGSRNAWNMPPGSPGVLVPAGDPWHCPDSASPGLIV